MKFESHSAPETPKRKRGFKNAVRAGAAALVLGSSVASVESVAAPVMEMGGEKQSEVESEYYVEIIDKSIEGLKRNIDQYLLFGDSFAKHVEEARAQIVELEWRKNDQDYLKALKFLEESGVDLESVIAQISSKALIDRDFLKTRINSIPESVRANILLSASEFGVDYDASQHNDAVFQSFAQDLSTAGVYLKTSQIVDFIEAGRATQDFAKALGYLKEHGVEIHSYTLAKYMPEDVISDQMYLNTLVKLSTNGVSIDRLFSDDRQLTGEQAADIQYVEALIRLRKAGIEEYRLNELTPSQAKNEIYLNNIIILLKEGIIKDFYALSLNEDTYSASGITEFALHLKESGINNISDIIDSITDVSIFTSARALSSLIDLSVEGYRIHDLGRDVTVERLESSEYMQFLKDTAMDGHPDVRYADDAYFLQKTGKKRIDVAKGGIMEFDRLGDLYENDKIVSQVLERSRRLLYMFSVVQMNHDHNESDEVRMQSFVGFSSQEMFAVIVEAGADAYDSSFKLLLDGRGGSMAKHSMYGRINEEYGGDVLKFFEAAKPTEKDISSFLELLSHHGKLDDFFAFVGTTERQVTFVGQLYLGLETAEDPLSKTAAIRDALETIDNQVLKEKILFGIRMEIEELKNIENPTKAETDAALLYELAIASYVVQTSFDIPWAAEIVSKYEKYLPNLESLAQESLFSNIGGINTNVQQHFFYDDRKGHTERQWDGHQSLKNYLLSKGISMVWDEEGVITEVRVVRDKGWNLTFESDKGLIVLENTQSDEGRRVVVVLNTPDKEDIGQSSVSDYLSKFNDGVAVDPHVVVHRGHSYHAEKTIKKISSEAAIVDMGSCGGYRNLSAILKKNPKAQILSTKGTGVMGVNDRFKLRFDERLLSGRDVVWRNIMDQLEKEFKAGYDTGHPYDVQLYKDWQNYVAPYENGAIQITSAFRHLRQEK